MVQCILMALEYQRYGSAKQLESSSEDKLTNCAFASVVLITYAHQEPFQLTVINWKWGLHWGRGLLAKIHCLIIEVLWKLLLIKRVEF